jgi:hypothetical protein
MQYCILHKLLVHSHAKKNMLQRNKQLYITNTDQPGTYLHQVQTSNIRGVLLPRPPLAFVASY